MLLPDYKELADLRKIKKPREKNPTIKVASKIAGRHVSLFKGRGLDFSEFREYVPGDDIRSIDWRVTARKGRPHTKLFTEERERSVFVIVDINSYMEFGTRNTFKSVQAARAAAYLSWTSNHLKDRTGAILFGNVDQGIQFLPAKTSRDSIWRMLAILCQNKIPRAEVSIESALEQAKRKIPNGSRVFVVSDFFELRSSFEKSLRLLSSQCDVTLIKITDPAEQQIPALSRIRFFNEEAQTAEIDTNDKVSAQRYHAAWLKSDATLQQIAKKNRVKLLQMDTTDDVQFELSQHMHLMAGSGR